jgi:hypothetical protein
VSNITDILGAIVMVALVTTVVAHPETAKVINAFGEAFSGSLIAAQGGVQKGK